MRFLEELDVMHGLNGNSHLANPVFGHLVLEREELLLRRVRLVVMDFYGMARKSV